MTTVERIVTDDRHWLVRVTLRGEHIDYDPITARILPSILGTVGPDFRKEVEDACTPPPLCVMCRDRYAHVYDDTFCDLCAPDPLERSAS